LTHVKPIKGLAIVLQGLLFATAFALKSYTRINGKTKKGKGQEKGKGKGKGIRGGRRE
jgi:hypothetical protein